MTDTRTELTISITDAELDWAIHHINNWIASRPVNTEPLADGFVSALTNPISSS